MTEAHRESQPHSWEELVERVRSEWGDRLVPVPPEFVVEGIHDRTREFLIKVGLPGVDVRDFELVHDARLLNLFERDGRRYLVVVAPQSLLDFPPFYRYGIDIETGSVQYLRDDPDLTILTNSSIAAFVLAIGLVQHEFDDALNALDEVTLESFSDALSDLMGELREWDPDSLADDSCRWHALLDDYGNEDYD